MIREESHVCCSSTGWFEPYHFGIKIVPRRLKTFFAYAVRNAKAKNSCASAHAGQCSVVRCSDRPSIIFLICKP